VPLRCWHLSGATARRAYVADLISLASVPEDCHLYRPQPARSGSEANGSVKKSRASFFMSLFFCEASSGLMENESKVLVIGNSADCQCTRTLRSTAAGFCIHRLAARLPAFPIGADLELEAIAKTRGEPQITVLQPPVRVAPPARGCCLCPDAT